MPYQRSHRYSTRKSQSRTCPPRDPGRVAARALFPRAAFRQKELGGPLSFQRQAQKVHPWPLSCVDLKTARDLARAALAKVAAGIDPGEEKKTAKATAAIPANDLVEEVVARFVFALLQTPVEGKDSH